MRVSAYGLTLDALPGWDARIRRHLPAGRRGTAGGEPYRSHPVLHTADFALPEERGDFGSGAVETMQPSNAFVALVEYRPESASTALFAPNAGMPRIGTDDFSPRQLQRTIRGQGGTQRFFVEEGRAFCLYIVLGSMTNIGQVVPRVNATLSAITIVPRPPVQWDEEM